MSDILRHVHRVPSVPERKPDAHKGDFGRVLIVGGSVGMAGAPALAGLAALRSGAGLATIAVPASVQPTVATICPCATSIALPETRQGQIDPSAALIELGNRGWLEPDAPGNRPDAVVIGPGVGTGPVKYARRFWELIDAFRVTAGIATVIDADALNMAHMTSPDNPDGWDQRAHPQTIITPHPGELSRMIGTPTREIQADREGHAVRTARAMAAHLDHPAGAPVVVLKGSGTIVTDGTRVYTNTTGNPGMATGGSGDVLAGTLGALLGMGFDRFDAAVAAVYLHGLAGDIAARQTGQTSLIATDIISALPAAFLAPR